MNATVHENAPYKLANHTVQPILMIQPVLVVIYPSTAFLNTCTNLQTSRKVLYKGTGATRITSGFLWSTTIPASCNDVPTLSSEPGLSRRHNWAPRCDGSRGVMIRKGRSASLREVSLSSRCCKYAVSFRDFRRRSSIEVSPNTDRVALREAKSIADGFEIWKPPAPGMGRNSMESKCQFVGLWQNL
jgi:hypothetical protein